LRFDNCPLIVNALRKKNNWINKQEMEPAQQRKKIVVLAQLGWSIERVHRDVEKQLSDEFEFKFYDVARFVIEDVLRDFRESDLLMTTLWFHDQVLDMCNLHTPEEHKKIVVVCHGFCEIDKATFSKFITYGIVSDMLLPKFPIPAHVVPNAVDLDLFERKPRDGQVRTLGWCGTLKQWWKRSNLVFDIARDSKTAVSIAETLPLEELKNWYHTIDVVLVTSGPNEYDETGPLFPFEAIASGVPVIGTKVGNFGKVPGPKFATVDEAVRIILDLQSDPFKLRDLADVQYNWVRDHWTYTHHAPAWRNMFRAAIEKSTLRESESRKKTREAAHAEMEPVRKIKIVFIASIGWSVERVHRDIEKQLSDAFEFKFYDCFNFVLQEFIDDFHNSDLCMMPLEIQNNLCNLCKLNSPEHHKKMVVVCHGFCELEKATFSKFMTYGILSDVLLPMFQVPVHIVPNGVDLDVFERTPRDGRVETLGWCGMLRRSWKRSDLLFDIARGSKTAVSIAETLPLEQLKEWYHTIDLVLVTSGPNEYDETGPLFPFEAIASGIPAIGTKVGNFGKVPGPKFSTVEEATRIILDFKSDPSKLRDLAEEQYNWVRDHWTYTHHAPKWREMFRAAIENSST
jgi:glycosyltransferase involved in cell wall biosynthesis